MNKIAIINGQVILPGQAPQPASVVLEGERIVEVRPDNTYPAGASLIDAGGNTVAPGLIDIHVHGGNGAEVMAATPDALSEMAVFFASHGVTSFLPTTSTARHAEILAAVKNVAEYQRNPALHRGARILGIHMEGPYISTTNRGAHPAALIRPADPAEYIQLFAWDNIRMISLAPEIPENLELLKYAVSRGKVVGVGHSGATYEEVLAAVELGLTQSCHTFNGMTGLHHRQPGIVGAVLTCDKIYAQLITDTVHVHPAVIKLLVKAKGTDRTALITDAIGAVGLPEGNYDLGGQAVIVSHGACFLADGGGLAGSVLTMDQALRNTIEITGLSLAEALPMATSTVAASIGLEAETGSIRPGYMADIIILDPALNVCTTLVQGKVAFDMAVTPVS